MDQHRVLLLSEMEATMTIVTVTIRTAIRILQVRRKAFHWWKAWRLRNPERDKEHRAAYRARNRDAILKKDWERKRKGKRG